MVPASFGRFDHAYCLTNHKSQGRTFDSAYVLANPSIADREWTYVAASRSRFATTIFVNASALGLVDPESHRDEASAPKTRASAIEALASRMRRSRAKGTSLDYDDAPDISHEPLAGLRGHDRDMGTVSTATRTAAAVSFKAIERARALLAPLFANASAAKARRSGGLRAR
jgi:hypothetical protein